MRKKSASSQTFKKEPFTKEDLKTYLMSKESQEECLPNPSSF